MSDDATGAPLRPDGGSGAEPWAPAVPSEAPACAGVRAAPEETGPPSRSADAVPLPPEALDALMPMHLVVGPDGRVASHGPLLSRLAASARDAADPGRPEAPGDAARAGARRGGALVGADVFEILAFRRRHDLCSMAALRAVQGATLNLALKSDPRTPLTGVAVTLPGGSVLIDLSFGLGVVEAVRRHRLTATDFAPTSLAVETLYLVEANTAVLSESRDLVDRLQGARAAAETEAQTDTLTGLRNRRALDRALGGLVRGEGPFSLMAIDLDHFKEVNDTMGHAAGDAILRQAAAVMTGAVRAGDVVARAGGDEFVILFPGLVRPGRLAIIADRLIEGIERPLEIDGGACAISASIGVATTDLYVRPTVARMTNDADAALYASKNAGRGRATIWAPRRGDDPDEDADLPARVTIAPLPDLD